MDCVCGPSLTKQEPSFPATPSSTQWSQTQDPMHSPAAIPSIVTSSMKAATSILRVYMRLRMMILTISQALPMLRLVCGHFGKRFRETLFENVFGREKVAVRRNGGFCDITSGCTSRSLSCANRRRGLSASSSGGHRPRAGSQRLGNCAKARAFGGHRGFTPDAE